MKVKVLETFVPENRIEKKKFIIKFINKSTVKNIKYLIERYYRELNLTEYIICEDYDFKTNTFLKGVIYYKLPLAYQVFNTFVNTNKLVDVEVIENDDVEGSNQ